MMVSIVIPARNEPYLTKTIKDLLSKAQEEIEIIAVLDGYWPTDIVDDKRVNYIHLPHQGMRSAINAGVAVAKGEYVLKTDAHCMFSEGYDKILKLDCGDSCVVVPRRLRLDPERWEECERQKPPADYGYIAYPEDKLVWGGKSLQGKNWDEKNADPKYKNILIDDLMSAQGSAYFLKKSYFEYLELMDEENYGQFTKEFQEISLKAWLSGGRVIVNKKVWYAHWHKTEGRGYSLDKDEWNKGTEYLNKWMEGKVWHKQKYDLKWFIQRFWPVPGWPEEIYDPSLTADNR